MSSTNTAGQEVASTPAAVRTLELFCEAAHLSFDRFLATRAIGESQQAIPGNDWPSWSRRLVEVGESLQLRVRSLESNLDEALTFVRQGTPIATCVASSTGDLQWLLLDKVRGRRVRVVSADDESNSDWLSSGRLRKRLNLDRRDTPCRWVVGQPALACDTPRGQAEKNGADAKPVTPVNRLLVLMRPEKKDLWVILVFSIVVGVLALASPVAVEALVNTVAFGQYLQPVVVLALLLFTFLAFAAAMRALITFIVEILQRRLFVRVVEDLAYRLPRARQDAFDKSHGPELVNRFFDVVTIQKAVSTLLLDGISIVLQTAIGMAVLAFYHPFLLGFDVVLLALIAFICFGLGRGAVKTAVKESKAKYAVGAWLEELARHPSAFKLHGGNQFALDRADQLAVDWLDRRRTHFRVVMRQILFALGLQALAATALLGLGGWLVLRGELTLGQLVAAELIVTIIVGSFAKLGKHMESFYDLLAAVDKLGILFDLPIESHDKLFHLREGSPALVNVRQVTCQLDTRSVMAPFELQLNAGESVALTGDPGSGKSTLVDLLCGTRLPSKGRVELDGVDLRELRPDSLRDHLAVSRSVEIFHGTINENVHLGRPYISAADVREVLQAVGLLDELLQLGDGLNSKLQTNGAPLSSSQAARLMLARAIVGRPRLLLIDGTLDSLPQNQLSSIMQYLTAPAAPWTLLVATHRREVMAACDRTIVLSTPQTMQALSHC